MWRQRNERCQVRDAAWLPVAERISMTGRAIMAQVSHRHSTSIRHMSRMNRKTSANIQSPRSASSPIVDASKTRHNGMRVTNRRHSRGSPDRPGIAGAGPCQRGNGRARLTHMSPYRLAAIPAAAALAFVAVAPASASISSPARLKRLPCHAWMSNTHPADYTTTDVRVKTGDHARVVTVAHYRTVNHKKVGHSNGHGRATIAYYISGATPGYTVQVTVTVTRGRRSGSCSTSFTPHS